MIYSFLIVDYGFLIAAWLNQQSKISNQQFIRLAGE